MIPTGQSKPVKRFQRVLGHAIPIGVHLAKVKLSRGQALFGGQAVQSRRLSFVLGYPVTAMVHQAKVKLAFGDP
jgi:hypothetical protein